MEVVYLVLMGTGGELDRIELPVTDKQDCGREVLAALSRERWVLSAGDSIEIQAIPE